MFGNFGFIFQLNFRSCQCNCEQKSFFLELIVNDQIHQMVRCTKNLYSTRIVTVNPLDIKW